VKKKLKIYLHFLHFDQFHHLPQGTWPETSFDYTRDPLILTKSQRLCSAVPVGKAKNISTFSTLTSFTYWLSFLLIKLCGAWSHNNEAKDTPCKFSVDVNQKDKKGDARKAWEGKRTNHRRQMDGSQWRLLRRQIRRMRKCELQRRLLQEVGPFLISRFYKLPCARRHVFVAQIRDAFIFSRLGITDLEKHLFRRHAKRIILSIWPQVQYRQYHGKHSVRYLFFNTKWIYCGIPLDPRKSWTLQTSITRAPCADLWTNA